MSAPTAATPVSVSVQPLLVRRAAVTPRVRRPTKPTKASRQRRVDAKKHRAGLKQMRRAKLTLE